MAISLRTYFASSDWPLGETRRIASADDLISVGASGKAISRAVARSIRADAYPEFYNLAIGAVTAKMFTNRTATGLTGITAIGSDLASTLIATGKAGTVSRSADNGATFTSVASGITADLGPAAFGNGVWVIPYATGKVLRSTNGGTTWTDTTVTGVPNFSPAGRTYFANGGFVYAYQTYVYWSSDGATWIDISVTARGNAGNVSSFTVGQGMHVLLCGNTPRFSADGGATWASGTDRGITTPTGGLYWSGKFWVSGGYIAGTSGVPLTEPAPIISGTYFSLSTSLTGPVTKASVSRAATGSQMGQWWYELGFGLSVAGADTQGALISTQGSSTPNYYAYNNELERAAKLLSYTTTAITGGPDSGLAGQFEDGTLYRYLTTSNQFGIKAASAVLELSLDAFVYASGQVPNANWYTRIK